MSDLWTEATHDAEAEALDRHVTAAKVAVADVTPFLLGATSAADYANRKAMVADRLDTVVQAVLANRSVIDAPASPEVFAVVRATLEARFDEDYATVTASQQAEAAREQARQAKAQRTEAEFLARIEATLATREAERVRKVANLEADAESAYDREDQAWFDALSTDDLRYLWALCCNIDTMPAYDDEVYDALAKRGFFGKDAVLSKEAAKQAGVTGPMDRSVMWTLLLEYYPGFGQMTHDETDPITTQYLADWAASDETDMAAFVKGKVPSKTSTKTAAGWTDGRWLDKASFKPDEKDRWGYKDPEGNTRDGYVWVEYVQPEEKTSAKTATFPPPKKDDEQAQPVQHGTGTEVEHKPEEKQPEQPSGGTVERKVEQDPTTGEWVGSEWEQGQEPATLVQSASTYGNNPRFKDQAEADAWVAEGGGHHEDTTKADEPPHEQPHDGAAPEEGEEKKSAPFGKGAARRTLRPQVPDWFVRRAASSDTFVEWRQRFDVALEDEGVDPETVDDLIAQDYFTTKGVAQRTTGWVHQSGSKWCPESWQASREAAFWNRKPKDPTTPSSDNDDVFSGEHKRLWDAAEQAHDADALDALADDDPGQRTIDFYEQKYPAKEGALATWVDAARGVLAAKQAQTVDGMLLDLYTASMLVQVYDALGPDNQAKFASMDLPKAQQMAMALINRAQGSSEDRPNYDGSPHEVDCPHCSTRFTGGTRAEAEEQLDEHLRSQGSREGGAAPFVREAASLDGVGLRTDKDGTIGWMEDWAAPYDKGWLDKGWVTTVDHNSGGLGGFSYRLTDEGKRLVTGSRAEAFSHDTRDMERLMGNPYYEPNKPPEQHRRTAPAPDPEGSVTFPVHPDGARPDWYGEGRTDRKPKGTAPVDGTQASRASGLVLAALDQVLADDSSFSTSGNPYIPAQPVPGTPDDLMDGPVNPEPLMLDTPRTTRPRQMPSGDSTLPPATPETSTERTPL